MKIQINNAKLPSGQSINLYLDSDKLEQEIFTQPNIWQADRIIDAKNNYVFSNIQDLVFLSDKELVQELNIIRRSGINYIKNIPAYDEANKAWTNMQLDSDSITIHNKLISQDLPSIFNILNYAKSVNKSLYINANILNPNPMLADDSNFSIQLGLPQSLPCYETSSLFTLLSLVDYVKCDCYIYNISCYESLEIIDLFKQKANYKLKIGINIHNLLLINENIGYFDTKLKFTPPLRSLVNQNKLIEGIKAKLIDFIYSGHSIVNQEDKNHPFELAKSGASCVEIFIPLLFKLAKLYNLNLADVLALVSINKLNSENIVIFDADINWYFNYDNIKSTSKISPFNDKLIVGKTIMHIIKNNKEFKLYPNNDEFRE